MFDLSIQPVLDRAMAARALTATNDIAAIHDDITIRSEELALKCLISLTAICRQAALPLTPKRKQVPHLLALATNLVSMDYSITR